MEILENFNLKKLNTFHVSAYARYFVEVAEINQLRKALAFCREKSVPFMLIGQGSNLLFRQDYSGMIIELGLKGIELLSQNKEHWYVRARSGENWHQFVLHCMAHGYYGLENLSLIPGTVGAAPVQNIGAYGVELSQFLHEVQALEIDSGKLVTFDKAQCEFGYRTSVFKGRLKGQYIICSVTFALLKEARVNINYWALNQALQHVPDEELTPELVSRTVCEIRSSKLPDPVALGNAGSFFWNPVLDKRTFAELQQRFPGMPGYPEHGRVKIPAAWLIEQAGWKGYREGDVGVHEKHALVLVNYGSATGNELYQLSNKIKDSVEEKFGIELTPEVGIV